MKRAKELETLFLQNLHGSTLYRHCDRMLELIDNMGQNDALKFIKEEESGLNGLQKKVQRCFDHVVLLCGYGREAREVEAVERSIDKALRCLMDILKYVQLGLDEVWRKHSEGQLMYQRW
jgi:hypothetical protein